MEPLAKDGGPKAFPGWTGRSEPKIGMEEFLAIARRFGFTNEAIERIQAAVSNDDLQGDGPNLARFVCAFPPETAGERFEATARGKFGIKHAMSVSSGTGALHAAFVAVGVCPGAEVIVPAIGFMATAVAVVLAGGTPVFCDVDESLHMDAASVEPLVTDRTVAIAPTHVMGGICDLAPILEIARTRGLKVVEDCAQSPGGKYRGRYLGTWGDVGCFSISAYKIIGGGEGGLVITNDDRLFERAAQLAECGGLWRPNRFASPRYDGELFPGANYRMGELEAAIDVVQLGKLDDVVGRFHNVRVRVTDRLRRFAEITPQKLNDHEGEVGYLLRFFPETPVLGVRIAEALRAEGVGASCRGSNPPPDWHIYRDMFPVIPHARCARRGDCPMADDLWEREVQIGLNQWATEEDCSNLARAINKVLSALCTQAD